MRWSKLKKRIESNFADNMKSRVAIHSTAYGNCTCGHAWITLDGEVIANFCTRAYYNRLPWIEDGPLPLTDKQVRRHKNQFVMYGELARQDVYQSCWEYLHDLGIDESVASEDPIVQTLAVLDKRLGKRRQNTIASLELHPLARKLFDVRISDQRQYGDAGLH